MYYLAINYGLEGWKLYKHGSLEEIIKKISSGETYGNEFKVLKELSINIIDIE